MWTNEQIENGKIRAELCESVTLTRDSYLELLETATYEQASRARVAELEGGCCDCLLTAYQKEVAETDALKLRLVEAARAERSTRDNERQRILTALVTFLEDGGGTFRKFTSILGMDYTAAYDEGWMGFTNALCDHESRILGKEPEPLI